MSSPEKTKITTAKSVTFEDILNDIDRYWRWMLGRQSHSNHSPYTSLRVSGPTPDFTERKPGRRPRQKAHKDQYLPPPGWN